MKQSRLHLPLALGLIALAGCGQKDSFTDPGGDPAAAYNSPAAVQSEAEAMPDEFDALTYADGDEPKVDMSDGTAASGWGSYEVQAPVHPVFFFRRITHHERRFIVDFERPDSTTLLAKVQVIHRLLGTFNIVTRDSSDSATVERRLISKRLADTGLRRAVFARRRLAGEDDSSRVADSEDGLRDGWGRWHLVGLSGVEVTSDNGTRSIKSVHLATESGLDITFTDPLEVRRFPRGLVHLPPDTRVLVKVVTGGEDDVVVLYANWGRMLLQKTADGSYVGRFRTPSWGGLRHIAVNALSRGTLFDDVAPYDSKAWGIPIVVRAELRAAAE